MKKPLKIVVASLAGLVVVAAAAAGIVSRLAERKLHRTVALPPIQATFASADGQLGHGEYLFKSRGCMECHGADGAGHVVVDDKESGFFVRAPNITAGGASPTRGYTDTDWVRTIRHGVKPSGEPLLVMPSEDYTRMTDADLGAIVAYVRSLPPADGGAAEFSPWPLPIKAAYLFGAIKDAAERIDHSAPPPDAVPDEPLGPGQLMMMTIRSHDQFNTTIYGLEDRYRGIGRERRVVLMNAEDLRERGLRPQQLVDLTSHFRGETRVARRFVAIEYPIPRRCVATYFPEANVLVPLGSVAQKSNTPASKSVVVTVAASTGSLPVHPDLHAHGEVAARH